MNTVSIPATMSRPDTIMEKAGARREGGGEEGRGASSAEGCSDTLALHILLGLFNI